MAEVTEPDFEGHASRECGEHRTTGGRAWCFDCSEWCYPGQPCRGCELPQLRATVERLQGRITAALHVLDPNSGMAGALTKRVRYLLIGGQDG